MGVDGPVWSDGFLWSDYLDLDTSGFVWSDSLSESMSINHWVPQK